MKRVSASHLSFLLVVAVMTGCAGLLPTPEERAYYQKKREQAANVALVTSLSALDAINFKEVGRVECNQCADESYQGDVPEENCRNDLRARAAEIDADLVVIESTEKQKGPFEWKKETCLIMKGRAYQKRLK